MGEEQLQIETQSSTTLLEEYERWLRRVNKSPRTIRNYSIKVEQFLRAVGPGAERGDIETYIDGLYERGLTAASVGQHIYALRSFYKWADRLEVIAGIEIPTTPTNLPKPISEDDLKYLLANTTYPRMRTWICLGAYCGLRVSEMATLLPKDIKDDRLRVRGKGGKERWVGLHPVAKAALNESCPPYKSQRAGQAITPRMISKLVREHFARLHIEGSAHSLRHRYATQTLANGGPLHVLSEALGHSSVTTTMGYCKVADEAVVQLTEYI